MELDFIAYTIIIAWKRWRILGPKPLSYDYFSEHKKICLNNILVERRVVDTSMFIVKDERLSKWHLMVNYGFMPNNGYSINDATFLDFIF